MSFDVSALDAACLSDDFSDDAVWQSPSGSVPIRVIFNIGSSFEDDDGVKVRVDNEITAGTTDAVAKNMKRGQVLKVKGVDYEILGFDPDGSGWTDILLEKA